MAAKKTQGSKPFAGQTGRKPTGNMAWGQTSGSGKKQVNVRVENLGKGQSAITAKASGSPTVAKYRAEKAIQEAKKNRASGAAGKKDIGFNTSRSGGKTEVSRLTAAQSPKRPRRQPG